MANGFGWGWSGADLDGLDADDLQVLQEAAECLLAAVDARLEDLRADDLGSPDTLTGKGRDPKPARGQGGGRGWVELKMIRGCGPYEYQRWNEGGKKRSKYIGKVKT